MDSEMNGLGVSDITIHHRESMISLYNMHDIAQLLVPHACLVTVPNQTTQIRCKKYTICACAVRVLPLSSSLVQL